MAITSVEFTHLTVPYQGKAQFGLILAEDPQYSYRFTLEPVRGGRSPLALGYNINAHYHRFSQINADPAISLQRSQSYGLFCLSGDDDKQKYFLPEGQGFCPIVVSQFGKTNPFSVLCVSAVNLLKILSEYGVNRDGSGSGFGLLRVILFYGCPVPIGLVGGNNSLDQTVASHILFSKSNELDALNPIQDTPGLF
jgi:hypothetical protein